MRNAQIQILNAVNTATQTGSAYFVGQIVSASFVLANGDATAAGTLKLQASNDAPINGNPQTFIPTNWADIPNATSTVASGIGPAIVIGNMCFAYIRAVYTRSGGGSTTIIVNMNVLSM